jgi:hypothetical protein
MPPPLLRSSLTCLTRRQACQAKRTFTTSSPLSKIGPESPKFIEIPRPPQRYAPPRDTTKGVLPVPRNLFPKWAGDKASPEYLLAATPEPTAHHKLAPPQDEYVAWKRRMAATRRQNLREGLIELQKRKVRSDKTIAYRSLIKQENRTRRLNAPPREDDRLTSPTIPSASRTLQTGNIPDPNRSARLAAMSARVASKTAAIEESRRDALHTLYMHARNFITTEKQLDEKIEEIFIERPWWNVPTKEHCTNIWEAEGPPLTVQDMLEEVWGPNERKRSLYSKGLAAVTGKRMVRIAEELTGGKMD